MQLGVCCMHAPTLLAGNVGVGPPPTSASTLHLNSSSTMPMPPFAKGRQICVAHGEMRARQLRQDEAAKQAWYPHRLLKGLAIVNAKAVGRAAGKALRVLIESHREDCLLLLGCHYGATPARNKPKTQIVECCQTSPWERPPRPSVGLCLMMKNLTSLMARCLWGQAHHGSQTLHHTSVSGWLTLAGVHAIRTVLHGAVTDAC